MNRRWFRRRHFTRAAAPFAVLLALVTATLVAHLVERPDPTDASFLSPVSTAGDGAATLAERLRQRGVAVERHSDTPAALRSARAGPAATVFVTAPALVWPAYLRVLTPAPAGSHVVLVAPDNGELVSAGLSDPVGADGPGGDPGDEVRGEGLPVTVTGTRWTAAAPPPGCADPAAADAGPAAVARLRYGPAAAGQLRCYAGGLVQVRRGDTPVTLVGAADPFRNDRSDEHGNAALAVALLARTPRLIWLDLHERERPPPGPAQDGPAAGPAPDEERSGEGAPQDGRPGDAPTGEPGDGEPPPTAPPGPEQDGGPVDALTDSPLARAFPAQVWAVALLLVLALLVLAAASARRLGAPVAEPLPVRVQATETVRGHGRLYQRARARGPSLDVLRDAALRRIAGQLGLPAGSPATEVADRAAAHLGLAPQQTRHTLTGPAPVTDDELIAAAIAVQDLQRRVAQARPAPQAPDEGAAP